MQVFPSEGENALVATGPRPMEWSTVPYRPPQAPGPNGKQRTSSLESPIMLLTGHQSAVYTMKFNSAGTVIASGSHDREIFLWNVHGDCKNFMVLKGHKNAVLDLHWTTDGTQIVSASPDKTLRAWDVETGKQIKKMAEHLSYVNSCCPSRRGPPLVVSGSDDGTAKLWDMRQRGSIQTFPDKYQITAVSFSDASDKIYTGGIDDDVKVWDLRKGEVTMTLQGHQDMITSMQLSPDGSYLLTNGMDCKLCIWDMRPYAPQNRCVKVLEGHQHNFEKNLLKCSWSPDGSKVTAGSSDRMVYIWDTTSRRILYKLPGHNGSVNERTEVMAVKNLSRQSELRSEKSPSVKSRAQENRKTPAGRPPSQKFEVGFKPKLQFTSKETRPVAPSSGHGGNEGERGLPNSLDQLGPTIQIQTTSQEAVHTDGLLQQGSHTNGPEKTNTNAGPLILADSIIHPDPGQSTAHIQVNEGNSNSNNVIHLGPKKSIAKKNKSKGQRIRTVVQGNLNAMIQQLPPLVNPNIAPTDGRNHDDPLMEQGSDPSHWHPPDHWHPNEDIAPDFMEDNGTSVSKTQPEQIPGGEQGDSRYG
ncbi:hypothetical protein QN277_025135 [Acacia crassicarpa]|uniref:Uncharacterized protein n=1 Tax=Acacia crassicarpa TaxID=499986 RepID=A0AAE1MPT8_9FABA|nr:hypothetical protein QN277_025135 [Acacia crassicarpa]